MTPPEPTSQRVVVAQVSDIHLGSDEQHVADGLLRDLHEQDPTMTVVSGDLTMRARSHQFEAARAYLDQLPQPLIVVPGNHDIPLYDVVTRISGPFDKYRKHIHGELDPVLQVPGATVLGLNSMPRWRWKSGHLSERQGELVEQVLGGAPAGDVRILVTHHPVLPKDLSGMVNRSDIVASAASAKVDLLLAGHTHDPLVAPVILRGRVHDREALSVVAGTAISDRRRGANNSYPVITVTPQQMTVDVRQWMGRGFVTALTATFDRRLEERP
ncbi:MAG: metallophosphoesterase [Actinomycetes bacterium]